MLSGEEFKRQFKKNSFRNRLNRGEGIGSLIERNLELVKEVNEDGEENFCFYNKSILRKIRKTYDSENNFYVVKVNEPVKYEFSLGKEFERALHVYTSNDISDLKIQYGRSDNSTEYKRIRITPDIFRKNSRRNPLMVEALRNANKAVTEEMFLEDNLKQARDWSYISNKVVGGPL